MGLLAKENQDDYRALSAQTAQQIIQLLYRNWKSYFQSLKSYQKDKSKFNGRPRIPKYKPRGEKGHYVAFTPIIVHPVNCHKVNTMALGNRIRMSTMKKAS